jgi:uncharacterized protein (DUF736 family)
MSDYDDTNSGAFFKNDKEGNENRPDYKGPINVDGVAHEIAGWMKTSKAGKPYMSLSIQVKREQQNQPQPQYDTEEPPFSDSIPF